MRNNLDIKTTSMTLSELETIVKQHMLLADEGVVKLLCAFVIAQRMETSPPWLFLVGASSGGKSMLLKALRNVQGYYALDDLTANTFVSGQQKKTGSADSPSLRTKRLKRQSLASFAKFMMVTSLSATAME
jgi:predicted ATPase